MWLVGYIRQYVVKYKHKAIRLNTEWALYPVGV
jgi:hypothetical protein